MENGKSPIKFCKEFFDILKKDLQNTVNNVLSHLKTTPTKNLESSNNCLNSKTKRITRIPKILETHARYKILTKILANRLK